MIPESAIQKFRESLRGQSLRPGEEAYDAVRAVPNGMIDRRPALIARCAGAADVIACVRFAREHDLLLAVRGGGHSVAGKSVCEGGLMVDLSGMKGMRLDPVRQTACAETGLKLGEFDRETQAFDLATTLGVVSATGIAGLTLGDGGATYTPSMDLQLTTLSVRTWSPPMAVCSRRASLRIRTSFGGYAVEAATSGS